MLDQKKAYFLKGIRLLFFLPHALCSMLFAASCKREWAFLLFVGSNGVPEGRT
jgi:hypothetical protein